MKAERKHKEKVGKYIKECLSKGHTIEDIKKTFVQQGYNHEFADYLIRDFKNRNTTVTLGLIFLILLLLIPSIFLYNSGITTLVVAGQQYNFTDDIGLTFNESTEYVWDLENKGFLKSIRLNGELKDTGIVKVYVEYSNSSYVIFDSTKLGESLQQITGFVVLGEGIRVDVEGNITAEQQIIIDNLVSDINLTQNSVEIEIENGTKKIEGFLTDSQELLVDELAATNIKIRIESEFEYIEIPDILLNGTNVSVNDTEINITPLNETNITIPINDTQINDTNITIPINETVINDTISKTIDIILEYKRDSIYDRNDDGRVNIGSIIDLTVENSEFNWESNEENLCTRWDVYSVENDESSLICYGSSRCCNFVDQESSRTEWDEPFYSAFGQDGSSFNNVVSAQVLYVDYNLSIDDAFAEIYFSEWEELSTVFYEGFTIFENICVETCILPNLNDSSYNIVFEINESSIILDSIDYEVFSEEKVNNPPILFSNISDISFFTDETYKVNLSNYFIDPDNDTLVFNYFNNSELRINIINETASLSADQAMNIYTFFIANDTIDTTVSNVFQVEVKERRKVFDIPGLKSLRRLIGLI